MAAQRKLDSVKVTVRLFARDVRAIKKEARALGLSWQTHLRSLVHRKPRSEAGRGIWKFIVPDDRWFIDEAGLEWKGYLAACVADSKEAALDLIRAFAAANGYDARWLGVATVVFLPVASDTFIAWVQQ
jgi:hypothetical protein